MKRLGRSYRSSGTPSTKHISENPMRLFDSAEVGFIYLANFDSQVKSSLTSSWTQPNEHNPLWEAFVMSRILLLFAAPLVLWNVERTLQETAVSETLLVTCLTVWPFVQFSQDTDSSNSRLYFVTITTYYTINIFSLDLDWKTRRYYQQLLDSKIDLKTLSKQIPRLDNKNQCSYDVIDVLSSFKKSMNSPN